MARSLPVSVQCHPRRGISLGAGTNVVFQHQQLTLQILQQRGGFEHRRNNISYTSTDSFERARRDLLALGRKGCIFPLTEKSRD
jgi:hypothetical protein